MPPLINRRVAALSLAVSVSASAQGTQSLLWGTPVPVTLAQRTIVIDPDTRWVNAAQGEIVRFVVGGTEFGWKFDGYTVRSFDLQRIAPAGTLGKPLTTYISAVPQDRVPRDNAGTL